MTRHQPKRCHRCEQAERIVGERFCKGCKKAVLAEIRRWAAEVEAVRDLSWDGTEWAGRKAIDPRKCGDLEEHEFDD